MSIDVVEDITPRQQYTAAASETTFDYPFPIFADTDLKVYVNETLQVLTTNYTVSGVGDDNGGTVTFLVPRTAGQVITIYRDTTIERLTDFQQNGPNRSAALNDELDKVTVVLQELKAAAGRTLRLSPTSPADGDTFELSPLSSWANKYVYINASGEAEPAVISSGTVSQSTIGQLLYPRTAAEIAASLTPVNYWVPHHEATGGTVFPSRYFVNTSPGVTDTTTALNSAATFCRTNSLILQLEAEPWLVSSAVNFSGIRVVGTNNVSINIQASSAQFNVITSTGNSIFENLCVHGGWDGSTAGQSGDIFHLEDTGDGFAYNIRFHNVTATYAKRNIIYWAGSGYSSITSFVGLAAGLHGLYLDGSVDLCTTVFVNGNSQFGATPHGYGAKLNNCVSVEFDGVIIEDTAGIQILGNDNRSITFNNVYQENFTEPSTVFLDASAAAGIGLTVTNCFGGGKSIAYPTNWLNVQFGGNSNMVEPAIPLAGRVVQGDSGELTTSTTGGVNVTTASVSLSPGTWMVNGTMQTLQSSASGMVSAACCLTTNVADSGLQNATNSSFKAGADEAKYTPAGGGMDIRLNCYFIYQNLTAANVTLYLRGYMNFTGAGSVAYRGYINAYKIQ